ncbi:MerR family transcriptional regulator [Sulfitobacter pseudonitzschiae]|uniref:MerR family transcriptional regulator n=3 Tax=Pseudosulfitobacter pseudonitzschiae TaxID=1402135 RepID=A0A9Q2NER7_9RHOB|nr:MerR family transcriptional regulator [Pseudosulfitobacter pseudonitzschiae]MBM1834807.1 MerR family transcriptional regulator [Pseudosulfitobacter pseudonitzschiae]MBM1839851.1 MerR family transcriptional regulator [Pseudosulfitobacter pseudonitzschiae]MBM1844522.1 MerR family transcriptional regulator [Pseudosulfitobacter pseudonitzschiae]MBM1849505.1 MerR family transcriptional regulator [Pseudosulfitobacter pseudonitzschiae]
MPRSNDNMINFTEMVRKFDITPRTLRYYEYLELLKPTLEGRDRLYDRKQVARFKLILRGRRFGMKLEEIRAWLELYDSKGSKEQLREWAKISKGLEKTLRAEIAERRKALAELRETSKLANELVANNN